MKKIYSLLLALMLAVTMLGITAGPASAHTGGVTGTSYCNDNGTWGVVWTFTATNTPANTEAEVKAVTTSAGALDKTPGQGVNKGGQVFLSVWSEHQVNVPGAPVRKGNWSDKFSTVNIPANVNSVSTTVQYDFKGADSGDPVANVTKPNNCTTQDPKVELCHATGSNSNPFVLIEVAAAGAYNGHLGAGHQNGEDIIPPFTYNGNTYSQNWDAEGQAIFNAGCVVTPPPPVDVCPNIPGDQPAGTDCTPPPPVCDDECAIPYAQSYAPKVTKCTGVITGQVLRNVVVPKGASCVLVDVWVNGDVRSTGGRNVTLADATVRGDVDLNYISGDVTFGAKGNACRYDPYVGGSIIVENSHNVLICQASVCKDVIVKRNDGKITVRSTTGRRLVVVGNNKFVSDSFHSAPRDRVIRLLSTDFNKYVVKNNAPRKVYTAK